MTSEILVHNTELIFATRGKALHNITSDIAKQVSLSKADSGICTVFVAHTSASLIIQENADPDVLADLERFMAKLAPEDGSYAHDSEGPDDMPAHIRSALTQSSIGIPIVHGRLVLGTWQAIYLWEHRAMPHERRLVISVIGKRN
jgi:secondary thiamine-phosphate synthase enzyme